ncbi:MAG: hypothetical protein Ct9H300mP7_7200 [Verrucomicrobiota bacterium]|nr:MAG: hypothetical protein Ct9H300mP7_7200 [Verrucomicrobiota bacterium]
MSDKIVPLISSGTKGPLGVLHLPRLWQKVSLEAAGKLPTATRELAAATTQW